jgi:hypothetical protein
MIRRIIGAVAIAAFASMAAPTIASAAASAPALCEYGECAPWYPNPPQPQPWPKPHPCDPKHSVCTSVKVVDVTCNNIQRNYGLLGWLGVNVNVQCINVFGIQHI